MTPDTDVLLLAFLFRIGRRSWPDPVYCPLKGFMSLALSLEDLYDRITALVSFDCPYHAPNLHSQTHCMNLPVHP